MTDSLYVPPTQSTPQQNEAAAKQLTSATFNSFGTMPNPQLVYEAIKTQSTVPIASAIQQGDPQYRSVVSASLAGGGSMPVLASGQQPQQQQTDVWKIDWKSHWEQNKAALKDDKNASFRSFGEVPVNNLGYMQGVAQQTDPNRIRQWQNLLQHGGFMDPHGSVTGVWDQATQAAFQGFMIARAMPDALYGQGSAETNARLFLSQLGIDTAKMDQQRSDPTFQGQVARQWAAAQGTDSRVGDKSMLQAFADQYGSSNLPASYQQLVHENVLDWLRGGMSVFADVPLLGRATDVWTNIVTGNFISHPGDVAKDPRAIRADEISAQMTETEKAALAPAIQSVAQDSGIMGLFDAYDRIRTKGLLAVGYAFGDAFSGRGVENPFDSNSAANRGAEAHKNDFIAGIMGDKWAHDNPVISAIGNFALNVLDDPISYVPIVDFASIGEKVPALAKAGRAAARAGNTAFGVMTPPVAMYRLAKTGTIVAPSVTRTARDLMRPEIRAQIDKALSTTPIRQKELLATMRSMQEHPDSHGLIDQLHLINEHSTGDLARERIKLAQKLGKGDLAEAGQTMTDEFGHIVNLPTSWWNRRAFLKMIGPEMHARLDGGKMSAMRTMGAFSADDNKIRAWTDPIASAKKMQQRAVVAGMKPEEIKRHLDALLTNTDPGKVFEIVGNFRKAMDDALRVKFGDKYADFDKFVQNMRSGRSYRRNFEEHDQVKLLSYSENPEQGTTGEMLRAPTATAGASADENAVKISELLNLQKHFQDEIDHNAHMVGMHAGTEGSPEYTAAVNQYKTHSDYVEAEKEAQARIQIAQQEIEKLSRPAPLTKVQLADEFGLSHSTYEMLAFSNPSLRKLESVQHHIYLDAVMGTWKRLVLARAATSMRITMGDDAIRAILDLAMSGHPMAATQLFGKSLANIGKSVMPGQQKKVIARSQEVLHDQLAQTFQKLMSDLDNSAFVPYLPQHSGYTRAISHVIGKMLGQDPMVQAWAKARKAGDKVPAKPPSTPPPTAPLPYAPTAQGINAKPFYHGTGKADLTHQNVSGSATDIESLFGQGVYLTDDPKVAQTYADTRGKKSGTPTVYKSQLNVQKPLDMEAKAEPWFGDMLVRELENINPYEDSQEIDGLRKLAAKGATHDQLYTEFRHVVGTYSKGGDIPKTELYDTFHNIVHQLKDQGYDALTHVGGQRVGGGAGQKHQVVIALDPADETMHGMPNPMASFDRNVPPVPPRTMPPESAAKQAIRDWYQSDHPEAVEHRSMYHADAAPGILDHVVDKTHDYLSAFAKHPDVLDWLAKGKVDETRLKKLLADPATRISLPKVVARRQTSFSDNVLLRTMGKPTDWLYQHITEPMVNAARTEGLLAQRAVTEKRLKDHYGDKWDQPKIAAMADSMSRDWMYNNTYQGSRSVMGSAMRNVFPFWGATTNMNRFFLRQSANKPFVGDALLRGAAQFEQNNTQQNGHMTLGSSILSHVGFSGGTALSFNPAHMLFITSDGVSSMVPGFGPVFTPLIATIAHNQHLAEVMVDVPGLGTQINYQTGAAQPMYPWLANIISGVGQELPGALGDAYNRSIGSLPLITQSKEEIDRLTDNKLKQMSADKGRATTPEDIPEAKREVGRQMLMAGGLSFAIPMTPRVFDERQQGVNQALTAWGQAQTDDQKDQVIAGALGVDVKQWQDALSTGDVSALLAQHPDSPAQLLAYRDRRLNSQARDQIAQAAPWVLPYDTSEWETTQHKPQNIEQFRFARSQGNIHLLSPDEYVGRVSDNVDVNQGWLAYDGLKQQEFDFLRSHGVDTNSQLYKDWHKTVFETRLTEISKEHTVWAKIHNQQSASDIAGRTENTARLSSVMTWQVIPQHSDFETKTSTLWRQALVWRDEAAGAINALHGVSGSAAQRQLILQGLQQRLQSLAAQDKVFQRQLNQFTFGNVSDLVDLESMQMTAANTPVPQ